MNNQIDITVSALIDNAVLEYEKATNKVASEYGLPIDLAEIALEKSLLNLKNKKLSLYASAMCNTNQIKAVGSGTETLEQKREE